MPAQIAGRKMISPVSSATAAPLRVFFSSMAPVAPVAPVTRDQTQGQGPSQSNPTSSVETAPGLTLNPPASPDTGIAAQDEAGESEGTTGAAGDSELTQEEQAEVAKLRARDREVRAHEQAHAAAGGAQAGSPSYSYQQGPDGKQYAVGGEVPIKASASSSDPEAAIRQLEQVVRAALAPAQPSGQDRAVAAGAQAQIAQLRVQAAKENRESAQNALNPGGSESSESGSATEGTGESASLLPELPKVGGASGPNSDAGPQPTSLSGPFTAYQQAGVNGASKKAGGLLSLVA